MKVLSANPTKDVGLCTDVDLTQKESLGVYTPARLFDWAKMLVELYGDDTEVQVQVFTHSSYAVKAKSLVASEDGENPYVVVTSWEEK
jgi:hypothetical protein